MPLNVWSCLVFGLSSPSGSIIDVVTRSSNTSSTSSGHHQPSRPWLPYSGSGSALTSKHMVVLYPIQGGLPGAAEVLAVDLDRDCYICYMQLSARGKGWLGVLECRHRIQISVLVTLLPSYCLGSTSPAWRLGWPSELPFSTP